MRIHTVAAPQPGAYSQGVLVDPLKCNLLFLSGQTGNVPDGDKEPVIDDGIGPQTTQALRNLLAVVKAAGGDVSSFVSVDVFLKDPDVSERQKVASRNMMRVNMNRAYKEFFVEEGIVMLPARMMVWVVEVPLEYPTEDTVVEIKAVAAIPK